MKKIVRQKRIYSLFVGRWQPFHEGHKKLIETILKKNKPVLIAIRDTEISQKNPYTVEERWTKIQQELKTYVAQGLVKIVSIPDIDEICYGREVGYNIRRIQLDSEIELISGTKMRQKNLKLKPIFWFTGQSGSGKTTLARALQKKFGGVVLDGDEMRQSISIGAGYNQKDRHQHNLRVARLALIISRNNPVWISVIAPFAKTRDEITQLINPIWIYMKNDTIPKSKIRPYQIPEKPNLIIDSDNLELNQKIQKITRKYHHLLNKNLVATWTMLISLINLADFISTLQV